MLTHMPKYFQKRKPSCPQTCSPIIVGMMSTFILKFKEYFGFTCDTSSLQPAPLLLITDQTERLYKLKNTSNHIDNRPGWTSNRNLRSQKNQPIFCTASINHFCLIFFSGALPSSHPGAAGESNLERILFYSLYTH